jgi:hypothetical protein
MNLAVLLKTTMLLLDREAHASRSGLSSKYTYLMLSFRFSTTKTSKMATVDVCMSMVDATSRQVGRPTTKGYLAGSRSGSGSSTTTVSDRRPEPPSVAHEKFLH